MLNKVPEVTVYFWIIKVLCTTVGETAADFLNTNLKLGLTGTSVVMGALLIVVLFFQFRLPRYVPSVYWLAVVLISIVGTLITDNLVDNFGVPLQTTTIAFAIALAITFAVWYASERTLSIHTIYTRRREAFYWAAVLFTFALGTAAGDLAAEKLSLGYWLAAVVFAGMIAAIAFGHFVLKLNAVFAFWAAYILTRPLGASLGDGLSQPPDAGGLGLGTVGTSAIFLATILALVVYLQRTRVDETPQEIMEREAREAAEGDGGPRVLVVSDKAAATPGLLDAVRGRAARGAAGFRVLVPNPAPAEWHPGHPERHDKVSEAERVLTEALPLIAEAAGTPVDGSVSIRHDPMDAIEETLRNDEFDEIIFAITPHGVSGWLHVDLPHRAAHLGLPVTTVSGEHRRVPAIA
jgi:uncharacterized membrane-anchored protein